MTSPRRGWMELPDVGDFCLVVIQKWMYHVLFEVPLHLLYVWYDIQSFGFVFLYILWIRMIWMQRQRRRLSFCLVCDIDKLRNVSFSVDMLRNVPYAVDMLWNISYAIDKLWYVSFVIVILQNVSFVSDMLQLLYAPYVMNQICMIERTIVILHLKILCLRIRIFCLVLWNFISLEIVLF